MGWRRKVKVGRSAHCNTGSVECGLPEPFALGIRLNHLNLVPKRRTNSAALRLKHLLLGKTNYGGIDARIRELLTRVVHLIELRKRANAYPVIRYATAIALSNRRLKAL